MQIPNDLIRCFSYFVSKNNEILFFTDRLRVLNFFLLYFSVGILSTLLLQTKMEECLVPIMFRGVLLYFPNILYFFFSDGSRVVGDKREKVPK